MKRTASAARMPRYSGCPSAKYAIRRTGGWRQIATVFIQKRRPAGVRLHQAHQHLDQRRFAGAVTPQKA